MLCGIRPSGWAAKNVLDNFQENDMIFSFYFKLTIVNEKKEKKKRSRTDTINHFPLLISPLLSDGQSTWEMLSLRIWEEQHSSSELAVYPSANWMTFDNSLDSIMLSTWAFIGSVSFFSLTYLPLVDRASIFLKFSFVLFKSSFWLWQFQWLLLSWQFIQTNISSLYSSNYISFLNEIVWEFAVKGELTTRLIPAHNLDKFHWFPCCQLV